MSRLLTAICYAALFVGFLLHGSTIAQFGGSGYPGLRSGVDPGAPADAAVGRAISLTANTANLESPGTLEFVIDTDRKAEKALTHDTFRSRIKDFEEDGSSVVWGVEFARTGQVSAVPFLNVTQERAGKTIASPSTESFTTKK